MQLAGGGAVAVGRAEVSAGVAATVGARLLSHAAIILAVSTTNPTIGGMHVGQGPDLPEPGRLPQEGDWSGTKGHSDWTAKDRRVLQATNYEPIPFRNGYPDFSKWTEETVILREMKGTPADVSAANRELARRRGWMKPNGEPNVAAAERYCDKNNLTWHHVEDGETMQLVPFDLNQYVPHEGGATLSRATGAP
jgi:hypothetical protein